MPAKKATKTANACATLYEGKFDINFDCIGVTVCAYARCELMPPDGDYPCWYSEHSSCISPHAKLAALENLQKQIAKQIKGIQENFDD